MNKLEMFMCKLLFTAMYPTWAPSNLASERSRGTRLYYASMKAIKVNAAYLPFLTSLVHGNAHNWATL